MYDSLSFKVSKHYTIGSVLEWSSLLKAELIERGDEGSFHCVCCSEDSSQHHCCSLNTRVVLVRAVLPLQF